MTYWSKVLIHPNKIHSSPRSPSCHLREPFLPLLIPNHLSVQAPVIFGCDVCPCLPLSYSVPPSFVCPPSLRLQTGWDGQIVSILPLWGKTPAGAPIELSSAYRHVVPDRKPPSSYHDDPLLTPRTPGRVLLFSESGTRSGWFRYTNREYPATFGPQITNQSIHQRKLKKENGKGHTTRGVC